MNNYTQEWNAIRETAARLDLVSRRQHWFTRRAIPAAVAKRAQMHYDHLVAESEPIRRMIAASRNEGEKMLTQLRDEEASRAQLAAGANLYIVEPALKSLRTQLDAYVSSMRRDCGLSAPRVLSSLDSTGWLLFRLLEEQLRPRVAAASPADLLAWHKAAFQSKDSASLAMLEVIEERIDSGQPLARTDDDLGVVRELKLYIDSVRDLRCEPIAEIEQTRDVLRSAERAVSLAKSAQIAAINTTYDVNAAAKLALDAEAAVFDVEERTAGQGA